MYNGSNHFGRAYQEELLRTAGVGNGQVNESRRQNQSREAGLLRRLLTGLFGRKRGVEPFLPELSGEKRFSGGKEHGRLV